MPISTARIATARAGRYVAQLADHLDQLPHAARQNRPGGEHATPSQVLKVDRADDRAVIAFAWGTCTLTATATELVVRLEASDDATLGHAEGLVAHRIHTIGSREQLSVAWQRHRGSRQFDLEL